MLSPSKYRSTSSYRPEYCTTRARLTSSRFNKRIGNDFGYYPSDVIGTGMSSKVYKGMHLRTSKTDTYLEQPVSIKVISKTALKDNRLNLLVKNEIRLLGKVSHPNVLKLETVV